MSEAPLQIGDRVITMQMPGIFTIAGRTGRAMEIVSDEGVQLTVTEASLRRIYDTPAAASDADAPDA